MKRWITAFLSLLALLLLLPAAAGQGRDRKDRERGGGDPVLRVLDKDGDGELSKQELQNAAEVLMSLDRDGDGKVTRDELRSGRDGRRRGGDRPEQGNRPDRSSRREDSPRPVQRGSTGENAAPPAMVLIPGGNFEMGDHHDLGGREHGNDEVPVHEVTLDPFHIGVYEITNEQYCGLLNLALTREWIEMKNGIVTRSGGNVPYCDTNGSDTASSIVWDGQSFSVIQGREDHPAVCIRWHGAAAYCNWLSMEQDLPACYDLSTGDCDFSKKGYRLPTEAEWEFAGRGGSNDLYTIFPWGDDANRSKANWPHSNDPYETGPYPWTTPVGFYNGKQHRKADFRWPGSQESYQTSDGSNGYGLHDVAGNVWEWANDWYGRDYYRASPADNPKGPSTGTPVRDGLPYRALRGGNWYNGEDGHSRVSNRNPSYYRGPDDPDHRWYHIGFRVARSGTRDAAPGKKAVGRGDTPDSAQERNNRPPRAERGDRRGEGGQGRRQDPGPRESGEAADRQIGLIMNTEQAWPGYTLFAPKHFLFTYLIDNEGQMIHSWSSQYEPGQSVYLLENGHLLHCCLTKGPGGIGGGEGGRLEEYDWEGNLVWEYWCSDETKMMHHDVEPLPNGNILAMIVEKKNYDECIAVGFPSEVLRGDYLLPEYIVELEKKGKSDANIVWEWHVWDHLIQDNDPEKPNNGKPSEHPERIWVEANGRGAPAFWNHMNSIDYNVELDQIMLSVRGCSELWIIDHSTTAEEARGSRGGRYGKGGDLLYRWGNPAAYGRGTGNDQQLFQQHDAQWIAKGCPGEGNILIFNNGLNRSAGATDRGARGGRARGGRSRGESYSSVDEIVPPMDRKGDYLLRRGQAFGPVKPKWTYTAPNRTDFFAEAISGCQRLPNGNTLICDGTSGVFFEVNPEGEKTWEYVCPVDGDGPMKQGDPIPIDHRGHAMNAVFKIERYPVDYPAFQGKNLTPKGKVTGSEPENVPENLSRGRRPGGGGERRGGQGPGERRGAGDRGGD
jgi:formylglycine-generating enzyme required for sulfatase activity